MKRSKLILLLTGFLAFSAVLVSCSARKPAEKEQGSSHTQNTGVIEMGVEAQRHIGLEVVPASVSQLTEYLHATGTVQPIDSRIGRIRPLAKGRVQEVLVKVGDRVRTGQELAVFDNIEAGELAAQYQAAQAELQRLRVKQTAFLKQVERTRRLVDIGAAAQKEFEAIQAEQLGMLEEIKAQESVVASLAARLRRFGLGEANFRESSITTIRASFAGVVIKAHVAPGEVVDAGIELFSIADLSEVWVQAEVYEKDLGRIHLGQTAYISVDTYPGERFPAKVAYISDILDPQTRTARVRCVVPNKNTRLKLDMFASVEVPTTFSRRAVAVPTGAVQQMEGRNIVFVPQSEEKFEAREVKTGNVVGGLTEIVAGLSEGEPIVTQGAFHLKSIVMGEGLGEE